MVWFAVMIPYLDQFEKTIHDVTVDVCEGGCGGIWFDAFELKKFDDWNDEYQWYLPDIDELRKTVQQLADLGQDVTPYADLEKEVIEDSLKTAEKDLTSEYDDVRKRAIKVVEYLKNMMTK